MQNKGREKEIKGMQKSMEDFQNLPDNRFQIF